MTIVDLTAGGLLDAYDLIDGRSCDFPTSTWRNLLLAHRDGAVPLEQHVQSLASAHLCGADLSLLPTWPALSPTSAGPWRGFAANALAYGLAYGRIFPKRLPGSEDQAVGRLLDNLLHRFARAEFWSNWQLPEGPWDPVSTHAFDACLVVRDHARVAIVLVVDED